MIMTVDTLTNLVMQYYDCNRDGRVNLRKGTGYEAERLTRKVQSAYDTDVVSLCWVSHARLFGAADRNQDGQATREEIRDVIRLFDKNLDGQLENPEVAAYQHAYTESVGLIRQDRVPRSNPAPDQGYSFYGKLPTTLASNTIGIHWPSAN